jgi:hypothetical protein
MCLYIIELSLQCSACNDIETRKWLSKTGLSLQAQLQLQSQSVVTFQERETGLFNFMKNSYIYDRFALIWH